MDVAVSGWLVLAHVVTTVSVNGWPFVAAGEGRLIMFKVFVDGLRHHCVGDATGARSGPLAEIAVLHRTSCTLRYRHFTAF